MFRPGTDPTRLSYDATGRLTADTNPAGGGWRISRQRGTRFTQSRFMSAAGRIRRSARQRGDGAVTPDRQTSTAPDGRATVTELHPDGSRKTQAPDGTRTETRYAAHPLWGWAARYASLRRLTTPAGRTLETTTRLQAEQTDPSDPFSLADLTRTTTAQGRTWRAVYAAATRTETSTSPAGRTATTVYDQWLRPVREETPGIAPVHYTYDDSPTGGGRLTEIIQGNGAQDTDARRLAYGYDPNGHLASITDPLGRETQITNDALGRPLSATTPDGRTLTLAYDDAGNLIALTPPGRPPHAMNHDAKGRETRYDPPAVAEATGGIERAYNADGDPTLTAHDDGPTIRLHYDAGFDPGQPPSDTNIADGRLWRIEAPDNAIDIGYDATGQVQRLATADGETLTFTQDGPLPLTETAAGTLNAALAFDYDAELNLAAETLTTEDGSSRTIDYGYDADGLLTAASAEGRTLTLTRDAGNGALTATALGAITTEHDYNGFGEPETVTALHGPDTLFAVHYTRDPLGRITEIEETILAPEPGEGGAAPRAPPVTSTRTYTYDAADRLHSWSRDGEVQETYGYDPNGNRTHVNGEQVASYDDQDRLLSYTPLHPRPIPETAVGYRIDPQQRRIARTENGAVTNLWVYRDDLNPVAELHPDGSLKSLFVYADQANTPAFLVRIDPDTGASTTYRYVTDHLGSPRLLVDIDTGAIAQRLNYDPWGRVTQDTHPSFQPFGFAGGLYDPATGLVRFGARDYDPFTGRWTAKDPIGFDGDGANLYGYVLGDPVNWGDSTGEGRARRGGGNPRNSGVGPTGQRGSWHRGRFYPSMGTPWQRPKTEMHHSIPREVQRQLPPEVARHPDVRGRKGNPNRMCLPYETHREIHRGPGGGAYNQFFLDRLNPRALGGRQPTVNDVLRVRQEALDAFGLSP